MTGNKINRVYESNVIYRNLLKVIPIVTIVSAFVATSRERVCRGPILIAVSHCRIDRTTDAVTTVNSYSTPYEMAVRPGASIPNIMFRTAQQVAVIQTAIVGLGNVAGWHRRALERTPGTRLTAVVDVDESVAERRATEWGVTPYTDVGNFVASESVDWVHVCTPVGTHAELGIQCLRAGAHVLVEIGRAHV